MMSENKAQDANMRCTTTKRKLNFYINGKGNCIGGCTFLASPIHQSKILKKREKSAEIFIEPTQKKLSRKNNRNFTKISTLSS